MLECDESHEDLSEQFSTWFPWRGITGHDCMQHPGVYLFAELPIDVFRPSVIDPRIIYVGETTKQT